ncbi:hypothetical protein V6N13_017513 [Hibiscus sabdariffa]|uniref:Trichome birefringence-like N-terminal domain-containing protein n=2 Tax=Hibiscus sabdariffa TaxID=183260 RepID=A0ABR2CZJ6_9ROSI
MGVTSPLKGQTHSRSFITKFLPYVLYALFPVALFRFYFHPFPLSTTDQIPHSNRIILTSSSSTPPLSFSGEEEIAYETPCNYTNGRWVNDKMGPLYNGTTCGTIKDGQNCISHGRPDLGYLYWRWQPSQCELPRNQLESLLCLLATASIPNLVYTNGEDNKFRRWHFASHNVTVSVYWSPFLVRGVEKSKAGPDHNELYVDVVDERWGSDLVHLDMVVLSIGHWFLHPAVYYDGGSVLGCHYCPGLNHTEIGFYDAMRKALKTALEAIIERKMGSGNGIDVFLTSFSPSHFEGEWDKAGACPKTEPYKEGEKMVEGMDADMRTIAVEEMEAAKVNAKQFGGLRLEILDVTKLSLMRPDGHPGPYMYPFPFANGVQEHVQNDCVHWCLPGPIDTWNQIMLQVIRRWRRGE